MALSGVRISWLILARNSDFAVEAFSASWRALISSSSLRFQAVMSRSTAQYLSPSSMRPMVMKSGTRPPRLTRPIASRPASGRRAPPSRASRSSTSNNGRRLSGTNRSLSDNSAELARLVAEQRRRRCGWRRARGRRGRAPARRRSRCRGSRAARRSRAPSRPSVASAAALCVVGDGRLRVDHQHQRVLVVPRHAEQPALDRLLAAIDGRDGQALAAVLDVAAAGGGGVLGLDEQAVEAAGIGQRVERGIAGPVEEGAVGVKQVVEPIDENADRQPFEDRPAFVSHRARRCHCGPALAVRAAPARRMARRRDRRRRFSPAAS